MHPQVEYLASAHALPEMLPDVGREVAFAGRSNAGKSSAINALAARHKLAFVSKTPGRTQTINFFSVGKQRRWVDLPGYGFAKVPQHEREHWGELISAYISNRKSLIGLILLADSRHGIKPLDAQLIAWFAPSSQPVHVLLTKADKLTRNEGERILSTTRGALAKNCPQCTVQLFSATANKGVEEANRVIHGWLSSEHE